MSEPTPGPRRAVTPATAGSPDTGSPDSPADAPRRGARFEGVVDDAPTSLLPATQAAESVAPPAKQDVPAAAGWRDKLPPTKWLVIAAVALLAVIALVVTFIVLATRQAAVPPTQTPSATSEPPPVPAIDQSLLTPADLQRLQSGQWRTTVSEDEITASSLQPQCLDIGAIAQPPDARLRVFASSGSTTPVVLQIAATYQDAATAKFAFSTLRSQLGACDAASIYVRSGYTLTKLADDAVGVAAVAPTQAQAEHLVLLSLTGATVSVYDFAGVRQPQLTSALATIAPALTRLCADGGRCPAGPGAQVAPPPAAVPLGWMQPSDLPLITPGIGIWARADNPAGTFNTTQCENMNLASVAGPTSRGSKTYIVDQDPQRPPTFGVDQALFVFPDATKATQFAARLRTNIAQCAARTTTATVTKPVSVNGQGANAPVGGAVFRITQKLTTSAAVSYRVGVVNSGRTVTYVLSNPSSTFDFTDDEWKSVTLRAGQRASQHP